MIINLIKFFAKLFFSLVLGVIIIYAIIAGTKNYIANPDGPYDDVTYMIKSYEKNAEVGKGTWCQCPVCDEYYYKDDSPCCGHECEGTYWTIVDAWDIIQPYKELIESYGKKLN